MGNSGGIRRIKADTLASGGVALVLILLVVISALAVVGLRSLEDQGGAVAIQAKRTLELERLALDFAEVRKQVLVQGSVRDSSGAGRASAALERLRTALEAARDASKEPARHGLFAQLIGILDGYGALLPRLSAGSEATETMLTVLENRAGPFETLIQAELLEAARTLERGAAGRGAGGMVALIGALAGLGLLLGLLSVWVIRRQVGRLTIDIRAVTEDLGRVFTGLAEGDLTQRLGNRYRGAFEKMADDVNATVEKLSGMVSRINQSAGAIAAAAAEIAAGGDDLAERTERQAASLEETAAAMEQLASTFKICCDRAQEANGVVSAARQAGENGAGVVAAAIEAMHRIVEASNKIKGIIRVTEEISRRTNMLALNAAVEAARAGEAGKGFGVVAREVGSLAERSAQASQQIRDLITNSDIQIQEGVRMVAQSGESLSTIVAAVSRAATLFKDIATSTVSQSDMLRQINVSVAQLDETTQRNAALAEQTCAASQSMREESGGLKELVSFFMIEPGEPSQGLGRHIVLIESTKLDHLSFMKRIREVIAGERDTAPEMVPDHHQCRLGKWYDAIEVPVVRLNPVFRTLERPHALVHAAARQALLRHAAHDADGCEQALEEMEQASAQVLDLIDELAEDLRSHEAENQFGRSARSDGAPADDFRAEVGRADVMRADVVRADVRRADGGRADVGRTDGRRVAGVGQTRRPPPAKPAPKPALAPPPSAEAGGRIQGVLRHADGRRQGEWADF